MTITQWSLMDKETAVLLKEQLRWEGKADSLLLLRESAAEVLLRALRRRESEQGKPKNPFFKWRDGGLRELVEE